MKRDTRITLVKGLCMIMVVVDHSGCPQPLFNTDLSMLMPIFFISSGYFFKASWFDRKWEYVKRKFKNLYIPFVKWSIIFLLLHNVFFGLGIINAQYGNDSGVTSHLYSLKEGFTHLLNIVLRMDQYEGFLLGAYWFLRTLLVSLVVMCCLGSVINKKTHSPSTSIALVSLLGLLGGLAIAWSRHGIPYFPQGGYRECMATFFLGVGYFMHAYERVWQERSWLAAAAFVLLLCGVYIQPTGLLPAATVGQWGMVLLTGTCGFVFVHWLCSQIDAHPGTLLRRSLLHVGEKTFYVFTFHFLMLKPASLLKAYIYDLDWHVVGCHPYVHTMPDNWFWLIYVATAVPLTLLLGHAVDKVKWLKA